MASIELDISHEESALEISKACAKYGVLNELLEEHGPAGGNPLYRFTGPRANIERLIREWYTTDQQVADDELNYIIDDYAILRKYSEANGVILHLACEIKGEYAMDDFTRTLLDMTPTKTETNTKATHCGYCNGFLGFRNPEVLL